ncbi:asparaginyl-tRNA synthetase isoform X1 [Euwallacea fornicatus]|uniref:asparaginyl-tRNA synthetase isoform X1 n=1 Tax=Euwallacea fornicatus TaxID=995702 RepID=UPI00338F766D
MFKKALFPRLLLYRTYSETKNIYNILKTGHLGEQVSVQGWIKSIRKQKEVTFLDINDGSTPNNIQVVIPKKIGSNITVGSSISTKGILKETHKGQSEVSADSIVLLGECDLSKGYPFAPRKEYEQEYVREHMHLRPRTKKFASVLRIRHAATIAIHNYLDRNGYFNIQTPIITSNDCEGAGEIFKVLPNNEKLLQTMANPKKPVDAAYFNKKAYLTVSGQLHLEASAQALQKVYCFGPTFRAENSKSRLHLSEFYMLELEKAFLSKLEELLDIVEDLVKNVSEEVIAKNRDDLEVCRRDNANYQWLNKNFIRISYNEALDVLSNKLNKSIDKGIVKDHEIALSHFFENTPVFILEWPKEEKPFYMKEIDNNKVAAFDLLAPQVGEIAGGSLRENNLEKLTLKIPDNGQLDWYLDLRKFGNTPTGGFGLGFERFIQFLLGIDNIKDCIPFPRWPHNCKL